MGNNFVVCIAKTIKVLCAYRDINITQLGYKLGLSKENFHAQVKRDNFRINDIVKIADILGYNVKMQFVDQINGKVIDVENEEVNLTASVKNPPKSYPAPSVQTNIEEMFETNFDNWKSKYEQIRQFDERTLTGQNPSVVPQNIVPEIPAAQNLIPPNFKIDETFEPFPWEKGNINIDIINKEGI